VLLVVCQPLGPFMGNEAIVKQFNKYPFLSPIASWQLHCCGSQWLGWQRKGLVTLSSLVRVSATNRYQYADRGILILFFAPSPWKICSAICKICHLIKPDGKTLCNPI
jgi:hypothetical protein